MENIEYKLSVNGKVYNKNLKISEELHTKIKTYCAKNRFKINEIVESVLMKYQWEHDTTETHNKIVQDISDKL